MNVKIEESWKSVLDSEFTKDYFVNLVEFVKNEYKTKTVYPPGNEIFNAFNICPFNNVKVVIIGQDPYHGKNQAHGLCFSVKEGITPPPSLKNIYKELNSDVGKEIPSTGNLIHWAEQGVLMLNAVLTVRASEPGSHANKGWETFTDSAIKAVSEKSKNVVFLLWGAYAQKKSELIDDSKHLILKSAHPSPFSVHRGFFGNKHFSNTNNYLKSKGKEGIKW